VKSTLADHGDHRLAYSGAAGKRLGAARLNQQFRRTCRITVFEKDAGNRRDRVRVIRMLHQHLVGELQGLLPLTPSYRRFHRSQRSDRWRRNGRRGLGRVTPTADERSQPVERKEQRHPPHSNLGRERLRLLWVGRKGKGVQESTFCLMLTDVNHRRSRRKGLLA